MSEIGNCRLCGRNADLLDSHIVPRFVYRWLKDSSATGYMRFGQTPNIRQQDGLKLPFLCCECEAIFNQWETPFANKIFLPYHNREATEFEYGPWMSKFCVSVSWRVLMFLKEKGHLSELMQDFATDVDDALATWAAFLGGSRPDLGRFEQHILPMDAIAESSDESLPDHINRYFLRVVEIDRICTQQSAFVYLKLARFILIGFIREPEAPFWQGTKVNIESGTIGPRELSVPDWLWNFFKERAHRVAKIESGISDRQKAKAEATAQSNPERTLNSETLRAMVEDVRNTDDLPRAI